MQSTLNAAKPVLDAWIVHMFLFKVLAATKTVPALGNIGDGYSIILQFGSIDQLLPFASFVDKMKCLKYINKKNTGKKLLSVTYCTEPEKNHWIEI